MFFAHGGLVSFVILLSSKNLLFYYISFMDFFRLSLHKFFLSAFLIYLFLDILFAVFLIAGWGGAFSQFVMWMALQGMSEGWARGVIGVGFFVVLVFGSYFLSCVFLGRVSERKIRN